MQRTRRRMRRLRKRSERGRRRRMLRDLSRSFRALQIRKTASRLYQSRLCLRMGEEAARMAPNRLLCLSARAYYRAR